MDSAQLVLLGLCGIVVVVLLIWLLSTSGSNDTCYNCGVKLPFGQTTNHVVKLKDGSYQNVCNSCDKRLYNQQKKTKGKYW